MAALQLQAARLPCSRAATSSIKVPQRASLVVRARQTAEAPAQPSANGASKSKKPSAAIHVIPQSRWPDGIPPVMGGHQMASGKPAPLSQSKGPGKDIAPLYFTYPAGEADVDVVVYENDSAAAAGLADLVAKASTEAIAAKGSFAIALSGGSLVKQLAALVGREEVDFSKWWVFWADERVVPHDSADSNYRGAREEFLSKVPIPQEQTVTIKEGLSAEQAASHYEGLMLDLADTVLPTTADNFPILDAVLLGVGPDGHVASLFPNTPQTAATKGWVLPVTNSPKPPPERITLTLPVLNAAKHVAVVAVGQGKAEVVQRVLEVQSLPGALPAQLVRPTGGKLTWLLDQASAGQLDTEKWSEGKHFPRSSVGKA